MPQLRTLWTIGAALPQVPSGTARTNPTASLEALALRKQPGGLFLAKAVTDLLGQGTNGSSQTGMPAACFLAMDEPPPFDAPAGARRRDERRIAISEQSVKNMPVACFLAMRQTTRSIRAQRGNMDSELRSVGSPSF